ncbi:hypothetical protein STRCR_1948 [Streptococcus criceti HS-6]|uniref:Uncharacterized protein n=1 Tax=Streptococcus criceti HS-6 TaxID=873449 RepID=G5JR63_STRCG|nr:hypothetical protein STRCR_1948 [Streptococcus criceti HS-6]
MQSLHGDLQKYYRYYVTIFRVAKKVQIRIGLSLVSRFLFLFEALLLLFFSFLSQTTVQNLS